VPALDEDAVLGPIDRDGASRALVRFDYASGAKVAESLRASVVSQALKTRRRNGARAQTPGLLARAPTARAATPGNTLRVRVDLPDLDL
jgi:primosomal protein N' (replication factor Y)